MHPAVKIVSLVILSIFSTQGEWITLLLTGVLILPFYIVYPYLWRSALFMLFRLKWLFFSILLIYLIFTPDISPESFDANQRINSLIVQISPALFRIAVLILIIFAVNLFLKTTSKEQILAALLWLFYPLKVLQIDINRISLRAVLTLEYIEVLTQRLAEYKQNNTVEQGQLSRHRQGFRQKLKHIKNTFFHLIDHSGIILREILDEAENTSGKIVTIDCLEGPQLFQYLIPVMLGLLFIFTL